MIGFLEHIINVLIYILLVLLLIDLGYWGGGTWLMYLIILGYVAVIKSFLMVIS